MGKGLKVTPKQVHGILRETLIGWWEDKAPRLGAALSYYTILALAPIVVLILPAAGAIFGQEAAHRQIIGEFSELVGKVGAEAVATVLQTAGPLGRPDRSATLISAAVLLFAASGVFAQLQDALDTIWGVTPKPGKAALLSFLRKRFLSFAMVLGICFLLLVSLLISAGLSALREFANTQVQSLAFVWSVTHFLISLLIVTVLFSMIFKVLPDATVAWSDVWVGAGLTAALFTLGKTAIGIYLGRASIGRFYGAAGSLVVLLVWVYYSAQLLYLGAEFTKAWSRRAGHLVVPESIAVPVTEEARAREGIPHHAVVEATAQIVREQEREKPE